jgi:hypothetical protein
MSPFRKSSGYPPLHEKHMPWQEILEGLVILGLVLSASSELVLAFVTHDAFLVVAFPVAGSPTDLFSASLGSRPVLFWGLQLANGVIAVGGWTFIGIWVRRRMNG